MAIAGSASAQRARSTPDEQIVQQASLVAAGPLVELYQHGITVDPAFLTLAEQTCRKLEALTGRAFDDAQGFGGLDRIPAEVIEHLGTNKPAPASVTGDAYTRRSYYFASYRFVKSLIDKEGLDLFMKLYASPHTEDDLRTLYGASRVELVRRAGLSEPSR